MAVGVKTGGRVKGTPNKGTAAKVAAGKLADAKSREKAANKARRRARGQAIRYDPTADIAKGRNLCPKCGDVKPLAGFAPYAALKCGYQSYCRSCLNVRRRDSYDAKAQHYAAIQARQMNYGMSLEAFASLLCAQAGLCASCDDQLGPAGRMLHVDHCHATGTVRGLLCRGCNIAAGLVNDSPERLRLLALYLERSNI